MRRVVLILTVISGLLCVGFVAACAYTQMTRYRIGIQGVALLDDNGALLSLWPEPDPKHRPTGLRYDNWYGITVWRTQGGTAVTNVSISYWLLIAATLVLPAIQLHRAGVIRRRRKRGLCITCGYDLRESKERCPECGTAARGGLQTLSRP